MLHVKYLAIARILTDQLPGGAGNRSDGFGMTVRVFGKGERCREYGARPSDPNID